MSAPEQPGCLAADTEPLEGNYFVSNYPPFSCWDDEGAAAYGRALDRTPSGTAPGLGLYVHVPFCARRCAYCYYLAHDDRHERIDEYIDAVLHEAAMLSKRPALAGRSVSFAYFGGGTPSLLSTERLRRLFDGLRAVLAWNEAREVTFECAPQTVTAPKIRFLRDAGVTRLSMGIQELDDRVLQANGRMHLVQDVERAWSAIADAKFETVNLDLIVGLLAQTDESFMRSLERVIRLGPQSVTLYQLEIPLNTPLYRALNAGTTSDLPADWAMKRERLARGFERLEQAGYEVRSAYSAVRDPQRNRFVYQDAQYGGADLLGLGVSSFSHVAGVNHQNVASLDRYIERVDGGSLPLWRGRSLTADERLVREFVLQLKLGEIDRRQFERRFGAGWMTGFRDALESCRAAGALTIDEHAVRLTRQGLLRVDHLIPRFYLPQHRGIRYS